MFSPSTMLLIFFCLKNMKKMASKVAEPAQIQPKSQFLFHKNLPPRDFSLMTLHTGCLTKKLTNLYSKLIWEFKRFFCRQS